jgi:hypothetical protein
MAKKKNGKWMAKAFKKHPGALHRATHTPIGEKISATKLAAAAKRAKKTGNARLTRQIALAKVGTKFGAASRHNGSAHPTS